MKGLFKCKTGSKLYGTSTPESDTDYKGVFISPLSDIIMKRDKETIKTSTGNDHSKNGKEDIDTELKELRTFLKDALNGQPYAIEMLFCNSENIEESSKLWQEILKNRDKLISKKITPFMGFAFSQSHKYSIKGNKLKELNDVISFLQNLDKKSKLNTLFKNNDFKYTENVYFVEVNSLPFLYVLDKLYEINKTNGEVLKSLINLRDKYGSRTITSMENGGIDWKSISHAYRVISEAKELLTTGRLKFPLENADYILKIKTGQLDYDIIQKELLSLIDEVKILESNSNSNLPEEPDYKFWEDFIINIYSGKVR